MPLSSGYSIQRNEIITIPHKIQTEIHVGVGETILPLHGKIDFSDKSWEWDITVNGTQYLLDRTLGNNFQNATDASVASIIISIDEEKRYWDSDQSSEIYTEGDHVERGIVSFEQTIGSFGGLRFKNGYHPAQGEHIEIKYRIHQEQWSSSSGGLLYQLAKDLCVNPYDSPEIKQISPDNFVSETNDNTSARKGFVKLFGHGASLIGSWSDIIQHQFKLTVNGEEVTVTEGAVGDWASGASSDEVKESDICIAIQSSITTALSSMEGVSVLINSASDQVNDGVVFFVENDSSALTTVVWSSIEINNAALGEAPNWAISNFTFEDFTGYQSISFIESSTGKFVVPLNPMGFLDDAEVGGSGIYQRRVKTITPASSEASYNVGLWKLKRQDSLKFRCQLEPFTDDGTSGSCSVGSYATKSLCEAGDGTTTGVWTSDLIPGPTTPFKFNLHTDNIAASLYTEGRELTEGGYSGTSVYMPYTLGDVGNGHFLLSIDGRIIDNNLWYPSSTSIYGSVGVARRFTEFLFVGIKGQDIPWVRDIKDCNVTVTFNWEHSLDVPYGAYVGPNGFSPYQEMPGTYHSYATNSGGIAWSYTQPTDIGAGGVLEIPKLQTGTVNTLFNERDMVLLEYADEISYMPGFKLIYPETISTDKNSIITSCNNISNLMVVESTEAVDILSGEPTYTSNAFSGAAPVGQKWRIRFEWLPGTSELKVNVATKYQLRDDGTVTSSQARDGTNRAVFREPGELCDIFHEPVISRNVTVTSVKNKSHFLRRGISKNKYDVAPQYPMSYRLTTTNHGVSLFVWDQASADQDDDFAWFVVQRHVNQLTGQPDITEKTPLHCLYSPSKRPATFEGLTAYYTSGDTKDFSPSPTIYDKDGKSYTNPSYSHWVSDDALFDGFVNSIDFFGKGYSASTTGKVFDSNTNLQSGMIPTTNSYHNYWRSSVTTQDINSLSIQGFEDVPRYFNNNNWNYNRTITDWGTFPSGTVVATLDTEFGEDDGENIVLSDTAPNIDVIINNETYQLDFSSDISSSLDYMDGDGVIGTTLGVCSDNISDKTACDADVSLTWIPYTQVYTIENDTSGFTEIANKLNAKEVIATDLGVLANKDVLTTSFNSASLELTFTKNVNSSNLNNYEQSVLDSSVSVSFTNVTTPTNTKQKYLTNTVTVTAGLGEVSQALTSPSWSTPILDNSSFSYSGNLVFPTQLIDRMSRFEASAEKSSYCRNASDEMTSHSDDFSCRAAGNTWVDGGVSPTTDNDVDTYSEWKTNSDALVDILTPHSIANKDRIFDSMVVSLDDIVSVRDDDAYILSYDEWFRHGDPTTMPRFLESLDANGVDVLGHLFQLPVFANDDEGVSITTFGGTSYNIGSAASSGATDVWNNYRGSDPTVDNSCINQGLNFWNNNGFYYNITTQKNFNLDIASSGVIKDKHLVISSNKPALNGLLPGDVVFGTTTRVNSYFYDFFNKTIHFRHAPKAGSKFSIRYSNFKTATDYMVKTFEDRDFVQEEEDSYKSINRFVVRESDVLKPWDYHLDATKHSTDSFAIINPYEQLSITDDRNFVFAFPTQLTSQRFYYPQSELDMICISSADFSSHGGHIEIDKYGDSAGDTAVPFKNDIGVESNPTSTNTAPYPYASHDIPNGEKQYWRRNKRKYEGMLSTLPNGNGMRIFFQVSGSSIRHSDVNKGIISL
jgi:hypothetical protein